MGEPSVQINWKRFGTSCLRLKKFSKEMGISIDILDLGGGIGIPYDLHTKSPSFETIAPIIKN